MNADPAPPSYQTGKPRTEHQKIKCWWLLTKSLIWSVTHPALSPSGDLLFKLNMLENGWSFSFFLFFFFPECTLPVRWSFFCWGDRQESLGGFSSAWSVQIKWKMNHSAQGRIWRMTKGDEEAGGRRCYWNVNSECWRMEMDKHVCFGKGTNIQSEYNLPSKLLNEAPI